MSDNEILVPAFGREVDAGSDHHAVMQAMIFESRSWAQILRGAAELGLADLLAENSLTASQIAERGELDPNATERFLRACVSFALVESAGDGRFASTALLETLRADDPQALRDMAIAQLGYAHWVSWGRLAEAVRTGQPQFASAHGGEWFDYYETEGVEEARAFARSLASFNGPLADEIAKAVDTKSVRLAIDVGGSHGSMVMALMAANPNLEGGVLDLSHSRPGAELVARELGFSNRFRFIEGDFFTDVPPADLYLLKNVLHDWPDERCADLLGVCRQAASTNTRLLVIEIVVDDKVPSRLAAAIDLTMLVGLGGRERTASDFSMLLNDAGFDVVAITPTSTPFSLIEAVPV